MNLAKLVKDQWKGANGLTIPSSFSTHSHSLAHTQTDICGHSANLGACPQYFMHHWHFLPFPIAGFFARTFGQLRRINGYGKTCKDDLVLAIVRLALVNNAVVRFY